MKDLVILESKSDCNGSFYSKIEENETLSIARIFITIDINGTRVHSYEALHRSLIEVKGYVAKRNIENVVFKNIGYSLDRSIVFEIIKYVFEGLNVNIKFE